MYNGTAYINQLLSKDTKHTRMLREFATDFFGGDCVLWKWMSLQLKMKAALIYLVLLFGVVVIYTAIFILSRL